MADRTTAALFRSIFELLADIARGHHVDPRVKAREFWRLMKQGDYHFASYQMEANEHLKVLGLARKRPSKDWAVHEWDERAWRRGGEDWIYGPEGEEE